MAKVGKSDNDLLAGQLGKPGKLGTMKFARAAGAQWASRRMDNDTYECYIELSSSVMALCAAAISALKAEGQVEDSSESDGGLIVRGVVKSGFLNANPAIVTIELRETTSGQTSVTVRGNAKEGLIKQHAGEKAANRVLQRLVTDHAATSARRV